MQKVIYCDFDELADAPPRELRLNGKITTCSIAAAFYQGLINCDNPTRKAPLSAYLQAEGPKRIPAFVFERLFIRRLQVNHEVSDNWYVSDARDADTPSIWFKLVSSINAWSDLDETFAGMLQANGIAVWRAWFEGTQLWLSEIGSQTTLSAPRFLIRNPCKMSVERGRIRSMLTTGAVPPNALDMLNQAGEAANADLIRSRIFINCFLELTGGRPFDIDAICRRDGRIVVTEFKRKYPSRRGFFGVDKHLTKLPRMLNNVCSVYHFVLEDRRGKDAKGSDPTSALIDAANEGSNFRWLVLHLEPDFERTYTDHLETQGSDSGQRGGTREQVAIPMSEFTRIPSTEAFNI